MTRTDIYQTYWLNAGMVKMGNAQTFIVQQATQNRILHSVHVVREKDGDDIILMVFEDEQHAKARGAQQADIPASLLEKPRSA